MKPTKISPHFRSPLKSLIKRKIRVPLLLAACVPLSLLTACGSGSGGLSGKSAQQVLRVSLAAARDGGSFHFVDRNGSGKQTRLLVGDTGTVNAQQSLTAGGSSVEVRLVKEVAYIRAPSESLEAVLGLSAPKASAEAGKWLSVTSGDKGYGQIVKALAPASELNSFVPKSPLVLRSPTTLHGVSVLPISGAASAGAATGALNAQATLFVSDQPPYRPVGGLLTGKDVHGRSQTDEVAFTRWGEVIRLGTPSGAVSVATIAG